MGRFRLERACPRPHHWANGTGTRARRTTKESTTMFQMTIRYARHVLTSLSVVAFGMALN
jgi:hypothetical protein